MAVMIVRLINGDELIGDCEVNETGVRMKEPAQIHLGMNPQTGKINVGFLPYANLLKETSIHLKADHIIYTGEPIQDAYNQYNTMFGSGLVVAGPGSIDLKQ